MTNVVSLASTAKAVAPRKNFAVDAKAVIRFVLSEAEARADLVSAIAKANYASEALMYRVQAARDWMRESKALIDAGKAKRFAVFDDAAAAHHLPLVMGTPNAKSAKAKGKRLIDDAQATANAAHRQWWKRLLQDAGVAPVNKPRPKKTGKRKPAGGKREPGKAAPVFAKPIQAQRWFMAEAALMLKTLQANKRAGSISAKCVAPFEKVVRDMQLAIARKAK